MAGERRKRVVVPAAAAAGAGKKAETTAEILSVSAPGPETPVSGAAAREVIASKLAGMERPEGEALADPGTESRPAGDPGPVSQQQADADKKKGGPGRPKGSRNKDPKGSVKPRYEDLQAEIKRLKSELGARDPEARLQQEEAEKDAEEGFRFLVGAVFGIIAHRKGDHWRLTDEEENRIGRGAAKALGPWLPALGEYLPWIFLLGSLYDAVDSRMLVDARIAAEKKQAAEGVPLSPGVTLHTMEGPK